MPTNCILSRFFFNSSRICLKDTPQANGFLINGRGMVNGQPPLNGGETCRSPPTADRYAALKDLDEQLRERKAVAASLGTAVVESGFTGVNSMQSHDYMITIFFCSKFSLFLHF